MLDFAELSSDGQDLELLVREILFHQGFTVHWSGKGADAGRDLVCIERRDSFFLPDEKRWLVQCKHNAISGKSVGLNDLDNIVDSCSQHDCEGYLLVCSTYPSSAVVQRLEAISQSRQQKISASYWDAVKLERILSTPKGWALAQKFLPASAGAQDWRIFATESPNRWVVSYKGYYFHLANRIQSAIDFHLDSIKSRVSAIEAIKLPPRHLIRIRAVHYDDKNGCYTWYLDYMHPSDEAPAIGPAAIGNKLGDGFALDDGQIYSFDVKQRAYSKWSDHHDFDHYDYYENDAHAFRSGIEREQTPDEMLASFEEDKKLSAELEDERSRGFNSVVNALSSLKGFRLVRSENARFEDLHKFHRRFDWTKTLEELDLETDRFFSSWFLVRATDREEMFRLVSHFPQAVEKHFRLSRAHVFIPSEKSAGSVRDDTDDELLFELKLSIHAGYVRDMHTGRSLMNDYFNQVVSGIDAYRNPP